MSSGRFLAFSNSLVPRVWVDKMRDPGNEVSFPSACEGNLDKVLN